jgi:hypothetical protein
MRRSAPETVETSGQDSFVDVVTNLVGIMIVLVIIVGVKVKHVWVDPAGAKAVPSDAAHADPAVGLAALQSTAAAIEGDVRRTGEQMTRMDQELAARAIEREELATLVAAGKRELADRRGHLEAGTQAAFDLKQQLAALFEQLGESQKELDQVANDHPPPVELKHFMTPISRTVFGKEVHFRLAKGRIAYVPIDELLDMAKSSLHKELPELSSPAAITEHEQTAGPFLGFEMRYSLEIEPAGQGHVAVRLREAQFVPAAGEPGEMLADALQPTSEFRRHLAEHDPSQTTATIWVYPEGFTDFRAIKDELYRLGYATAARPLPTGANVSGSADHGTRSAAQ